MMKNEKEKLHVEVEFPEGANREEKAIMIKTAIKGFEQMKVRRYLAMAGIAAGLTAAFFVLTMTGVLSVLHTALTYAAAVGFAIGYTQYLAGIYKKGDAKMTRYALTVLCCILGVFAYDIGAVKLSDSLMRSRENLLFAASLYLMLTLAQQIVDTCKERKIARSLKSVADALAEDAQ